MPRATVHSHHRFLSFPHALVPRGPAQQTRGLNMAQALLPVDRQLQAAIPLPKTFSPVTNHPSLSCLDIVRHSLYPVPMPPRITRSAKLDLRLTPKTKSTLRAAAAASNRSLSDFVLESALNRATE